jgi:hypothetical protein
MNKVSCHLKSSSHDLADIGVLLREARSICIGWFESYEYRFCPRDCNKAAHELAQFGLYANTECIGWAESAPPFVPELVASESAAAKG